MGNGNIGPHGQMGASSQAKEWARHARIACQIDGTELFDALPNDGVRLFRHYFTEQNLGADAAWVAGQILGSLKGYRHPNLFVQVYVGIPSDQVGAYINLLRQVVPILHAAGVKVAGPGWYTGSYDQAAWDAMRAAGWCGLNAVCLQAYWAGAGLTQWNALRYRTYWDRSRDPKALFIGECGRDLVRDGPNGSYIGKGGWKADGITAEQMVNEYAGFDGEIAKDGVLAVAFTSAPNDEWKNYSTDELDTRRLYRDSSGILWEETAIGKGDDTVTNAEIVAKLAVLSKQNALLTEALRRIRQNRWGGADGLDGLIVAMQGGKPLGFTPSFPKA